VEDQIHKFVGLWGVSLIGKAGWVWISPDVGSSPALPIYQSLVRKSENIHMKNLKALHYEMVDLIKEDEEREKREAQASYESDAEYGDYDYDYHFTDLDPEEQYWEDVANGLFDDYHDYNDYAYEDDYGYDDDDYHIMTAEDLKILEDMLGEI